MSDPWVPSAELQDRPGGAIPEGRGAYDVRTIVDIATGVYTDRDTGEMRTWWEQRMYLQARYMGQARDLAELRQVGSDMQALWGRKPEFYDDWFGRYIPEYRLPNPRANLTQLNATYGGDPPWPNGPLPGGY